MSARTGYALADLDLHQKVALMPHSTVNRRDFCRAACLAGAVGASFANSLAAGSSISQPRLKLALKYHMIDEPALSMREKFELVKKIGFEGIEVRTRDKLDRQELVAARDMAELPIHGIINSNSPDIKSAVDLAVDVGADSVLVVAGRVTKEVSYDDNYREWTDRIKAEAPYAADQGVRLLVENVWNNFLMSPLEMAQFIDEIDHPAVGVYMDVGNVVRIGYPEQWIRILGNRIGKLDIKAYSRQLQMNEGARKGFQVPIGEGDVDYPAVLTALEEIDYSGWATAEVPGGNAERLREIFQQMRTALQPAS